MLNYSRARLTVASVAALLCGCGTQTVALQEPVLPQPLVEQLPLRVGVRYSPEMHDFTHREEMLRNQEWTIHLGDANRLLYDQIFASMFTGVVRVEQGQDPAQLGIDLLIEPSIDGFEFALPQQSRSESYTVWIRYRLRVFDPTGKEIANWPVSAYGKSEARRFSGTKAMQRAAALAMRDAAALVTMRFGKETGLAPLDPNAPPDPADAVADGQLAETGEAVPATPPNPDSPGSEESASDAAGKENFTNDRG